jgi:hypothetical protein
MQVSPHPQHPCKHTRRLAPVSIKPRQARTPKFSNVVAHADPPRPQPQDNKGSPDIGRKMPPGPSAPLLDSSTQQTPARSFPRSLDADVSCFRSSAVRLGPPKTFARRVPHHSKNASTSELVSPRLYCANLRGNFPKPCSFFPPKDFSTSGCSFWPNKPHLRRSIAFPQAPNEKRPECYL